MIMSKQNLPSSLNSLWSILALQPPFLQIEKSSVFIHRLPLFSFYFKQLRPKQCFFCADPSYSNSLENTSSGARKNESQNNQIPNYGLSTKLSKSQAETASRRLLELRKKSKEDAKEGEQKVNYCYQTLTYIFPVKC